MRNRYVLELSKDGYMKYISHLDLMRLLRNAFRKAGVRLRYSEGYSPHPKISLAQPLALGYSSSCEALEFELKEDMRPSDIIAKVNAVVPCGIEAGNCRRLSEGEKGLAARLYAAAYEIRMPALPGAAGVCGEFLGLETVFAQKKRKKTGKTEEINIRGMIRELRVENVDNNLVMYTILDSGPSSNLSPELLISAFCGFAGAGTRRDEIDVKRTGLLFL